MAEDKIKIYNKVAVLPKNTKASKALTFLESIKIPKNKLWYFIIEKEMTTKDGKESEFEELQTIKYNNKCGFNLLELVTNLTEHYKKEKPDVYEYVKELKIVGENKFSVIKNIPKVEINGKTLISILTEDMIRLLYK